MTGVRFLFVLAVLGTHAAAAADTDAMHGADARSRVLVADATSPDTSDRSLRQRAEDLAGAASQRFSEILSTDKPAPPPSADKPAAEPGSGTFAPVWNWLARASQDYEDVVISKLKSPDGWVVVVQRSDATAPSPMPTPDPGTQEEPQTRQLRGWSGVVEMMRDWLARANRSYRNEIVERLVEPSEQEAPKATAEEPARAAPPSAPTPSATAPAPSAAPPAPSAAPPPAPPVAVEAAPAKSDAGEAKRKAEAEDRIKLEAEAADAKRKADAEAQAKREATAAAEAKRKFDADAAASRVAVAAEAKRKADAEAAEAKHEAEDAKRIAEEGDAERKAVAEAEATRLATEAEEKRKAEREAKSRRAVQAASEAAAENAAPAPAKELEKTENSSIATDHNTALSDGAPADSAPVKSAPTPAAPEMPERAASPESSQPRETVAQEAVPPPATPGVASKLAQADAAHKPQHVRRHKPVAYAKHRKRGRGYVYGYKKPRALPVETLYRVPHCQRQCRCAGVSGYRRVRLVKPRQRVALVRQAAPRFYVSEVRVRRPYRVHYDRVGRTSLTYRRHRLYIPSHTY